MSRASLTRATSLSVLAAFLCSFVLAEPLLAVAEAVREGRETVRAAERSGRFVLPNGRGWVARGALHDRRLLVVCIQDLHCHPEVQRNICEIIGLLDRRCAVTKIFLEGAAAGRIDTGLLSRLPGDELRSRTAESLLESGLLTGAEYYAVTRSADKLFGIEDPGVYRDNLERARRILDARSAHERVTDGFAAAAESLKRLLLSPEMRRLERRLRQPSEGKAQEQWFLRLEKLGVRFDEEVRDYPNLQRFVSLIRLRRGIRFRNLPAEHRRYLSELRAVLPYDRYRSLADKGGRAGSRDEYYRELAAVARASTPGMAARYPNLHGFLEYLQLNARIDPAALTVEKRLYAERLLAARSRTRLDREILFLSGMSGYLRDFAALRITPDEFRYFRENRDRFRTLLVKHLGLGETSGALRLLDDEDLNRFYEVNLARNDIFVRAVAGETRAGSPPARGIVPPADPAGVLERIDEFDEVRVVVTGGFHEAVAAELGRRGISYLVVTPNAAEGYDQGVYERILRGELTLREIGGSAFAPEVWLTLEAATFYEKLALVMTRIPAVQEDPVLAEQAAAEWLDGLEDLLKERSIERPTVRVTEERGNYRITVLCGDSEKSVYECRLEHGGVTGVRSIRAGADAPLSPAGRSRPERSPLPTLAGSGIRVRPDPASPLAWLVLREGVTFGRIRLEANGSREGVVAEFKLEPGEQTVGAGRLLLDVACREARRAGIVRISAAAIRDAGALTWKDIAGDEHAEQDARGSWLLDMDMDGRERFRLSEPFRAALGLAFLLARHALDPSVRTARSILALFEEEVLDEEETKDLGYARDRDFLRDRVMALAGPIPAFSGFSCDIRITDNPDLVAEDAWAMAVFDVDRENRRMTLLVHDAFFRALRSKTDGYRRYLLELLAWHELNEYLALHGKDDEGVFFSFSSYLERLGRDGSAPGQRNPDAFHEYLRLTRPEQGELLVFAEEAAAGYGNVLVGGFVISPEGRPGPRRIIIPPAQKGSPMHYWLEGQFGGYGDLSGVSYVHTTTRTMMEAMLAFDRETGFSGLTVLDAGCGRGDLSVLAGKLNARKVHAVDRDAGIVAAASDLAKLNGVDGIEFVAADFEDLPVNPAVDVVLVSLGNDNFLPSVELLLRKNPRARYLIALGGNVLIEESDIHREIDVLMNGIGSVVYRRVVHDHTALEDTPFAAYPVYIIELDRRAPVSSPSPTLKERYAAAEPREDGTATVPGLADRPAAVALRIAALAPERIGAPLLDFMRVIIGRFAAHALNREWFIRLDYARTADALTAALRAAAEKAGSWKGAGRRVRVEIGDDPALIGKDAWTLAVLDVNDERGEIVLYVHEILMRALRDRAPPRERGLRSAALRFVQRMLPVAFRGRAADPLVQLLAEHEIREHLAFNEPGSGEQLSFHRYLAAAGGLPPSQPLFHRYLEETSPGQARLLELARSAVRDRATVLDSAFEGESDFLFIGGGTGISSIIEAFNGHAGVRARSIISFMDNGGSSGEMMLDVAREWRRHPPVEQPAPDALRAETIVHPGDLMSAMADSIPEAWKRDTLKYRSRDAVSARRLLDEAYRKTLALHRDDIDRGLVNEREIEEFARQLSGVASWVDDHWIRPGKLRVHGISHSVQNLLLFGTAFIEGAYEPGWVIPSRFNRAISRIASLIGSRSPAVPTSLRSFLDFRFVARLEREETMLVKDKDTDRYQQVTADVLEGQENITGVFHDTPIRRAEFLDAQGNRGPPPAHGLSVEMIRKARCIVIGPGSFFTSILPNLAADGVVEELISAKARGVPVVFVFNTTQDAETIGHTVRSLVEALEDSLRAALGRDYRFEDFVGYAVFNRLDPDDPAIGEYLKLERSEIERLRHDTSRIHELGKLTLGLFENEDTDAVKAFLKSRGVKPLVAELASLMETKSRDPGGITTTSHYRYTPGLLAFYLALLERRGHGGRFHIASDVDETLSAPHAVFTDAMVRKIAAVLRSGRTFSIVTANTMESLQKRVIGALMAELGDECDLLSNLHVTTNTGAQIWEYQSDSREFDLIEALDMREMVGGQDGIDRIAGIIREAIERFDIRPVRGEQIDRRPNGKGGVASLAFVTTGLGITPEEKERLDRQEFRERRETWADFINARFREEGIAAEARVAGQTSIDILPHGVDKGYAIRRLAAHYGLDPRSFIFYGDSFMSGGNDYPATSEVGMVVNVGKRAGPLPVPSFSLPDSGPAGTEHFLDIILEMDREGALAAGSLPAVAFSHNIRHIVGLAARYGLLCAGGGIVPGSPADMLGGIHALFARSRKETAAFAGSRRAVAGAIGALEEFRGFRVKVEVSDAEVLAQREGWAFASTSVNSSTREVTVYIHEVFLRALEALEESERLRLLALLAQHEAWEYLALHLRDVRLSRPYFEFKRFLAGTGRSPEYPEHFSAELFHEFLSERFPEQASLTAFARGTAGAEFEKTAELRRRLVRFVFMQHDLKWLWEQYLAGIRLRHGYGIKLSRLDSCYRDLSAALERIEDAAYRPAIEQMLDGLETSRAGLLGELSAVRAALEEAIVHPREESAVGDLWVLIEQTNEIESILSDAGVPVPTDISRTLEWIVGSYRVKHRGMKIRLENRLSDREQFVMANKYHLKRIIGNLLSNAEEAFSRAGRARPLVEIVVEETPEEISITCRDNAGGLDERIMDSATRPGVTTKPDSPLSGFGLSICEDMARKLNARFSFESRPGDGTTFTLAIPAERIVYDSRTIRVPHEDSVRETIRSLGAFQNRVDGHWLVAQGDYSCLDDVNGEFKRLAEELAGLERAGYGPLLDWYASDFERYPVKTLRAMRIPLMHAGQERWLEALKALDARLEDIRLKHGDRVAGTIRRMVGEIEGAVPFSTYRLYILNLGHGLAHSLRDIDLALSFLADRGLSGEEVDRVIAVGLYHDITSLLVRKDHHLDGCALAERTLRKFRDEQGVRRYADGFADLVGRGCRNHRGREYCPPEDAIEQAFVDADEIAALDVDRIMEYNRSALFRPLFRPQFWEVYRKYMLREKPRLFSADTFRHETVHADVFQFMLFLLFERTDPENYYTQAARDLVSGELYGQLRDGILRSLGSEFSRDLSGGLGTEEQMTLMRSTLLELEALFRNNRQAMQELRRSIGSRRAFMERVDLLRKQVVMLGRERASVPLPAERQTLLTEARRVFSGAWNARPAAPDPAFAAGVDLMEAYLENPDLDVDAALARFPDGQPVFLAGMAFALARTAADRLEDIARLAPGRGRVPHRRILAAGGAIGDSFMERFARGDRAGSVLEDVLRDLRGVSSERGSASVLAPVLRALSAAVSPKSAAAAAFEQVPARHALAGRSFVRVGLDIEERSREMFPALSALGVVPVGIGLAQAGGAGTLELGFVDVPAGEADILVRVTGKAAEGGTLLFMEALPAEQQPTAGARRFLHATERETLESVVLGRGALQLIEELANGRLSPSKNASVRALGLARFDPVAVELDGAAAALGRFDAASDRLSRLPLLRGLTCCYRDRGDARRVFPAAGTYPGFDAGCAATPDGGTDLRLLGLLSADVRVSETHDAAALVADYPVLAGKPWLWPDPAPGAGRLREYLDAVSNAVTAGTGMTGAQLKTTPSRELFIRGTRGAVAAKLVSLRGGAGDVGVGKISQIGSLLRSLVKSGIGVLQLQGRLPGETSYPDTSGITPVFVDWMKEAARINPKIANEARCRLAELSAGEYRVVDQGLVADVRECEAGIARVCLAALPPGDRVLLSRFMRDDPWLDRYLDGLGRSGVPSAGLEGADRRMLFGYMVWVMHAQLREEAEKARSQGGRVFWKMDPAAPGTDASEIVEDAVHWLRVFDGIRLDLTALYAAGEGESFVRLLYAAVSRLDRDAGVLIECPEAYAGDIRREYGFETIRRTGAESAGELRAQAAQGGWLEIATAGREGRESAVLVERAFRSGADGVSVDIVPEGEDDTLAVRLPLRGETDGFNILRFIEDIPSLAAGGRVRTPEGLYAEGHRMGLQAAGAWSGDEVRGFLLRSGGMTTVTLQCGQEQQELAAPGLALIPVLRARARELASPGRPVRMTLEGREADVPSLVDGILSRAAAEGMAAPDHALRYGLRTIASEVLRRSAQEDPAVLGEKLEGFLQGVLEGIWGGEYLRSGGSATAGPEFRRLRKLLGVAGGFISLRGGLRILSNHTRPGVLDTRSVLAGLPWLLRAGLVRPSDAWEMLKRQASVSVNTPLIPSRFLEGKPEYSDDDASLWFVEAAFRVWEGMPSRNDDLVMRTSDIVRYYQRRGFEHLTPETRVLVWNAIHVLKRMDRRKGMFFDPEKHLLEEELLRDFGREPARYGNSDLLAALLLLSLSGEHNRATVEKVLPPERRSAVMAEAEKRLRTDKGLNSGDGRVLPALMARYVAAHRAVSERPAAEVLARLRDELDPLVRRIVRDGKLPEAFAGGQPYGPDDCLLPVAAVTGVFADLLGTEQGSPAFDAGELRRAAPVVIRDTVRSILSAS